VLAEARTFNNQIFFTSYTPSPLQAAIDCGPALGSNRLYIIDIFNGAPVNNLDGLGDDEQLTLTDRYQEFEGSIASEPVLLFPSPEDPEDPNCVGDQCTPPPLACVDLFCFPAGFTNEPVRTFWSQDTAR
jgi:type IV pilus assembly protein PilY1